MNVEDFPEGYTFNELIAQDSVSSIAMLSIFVF